VRIEEDGRGEAKGFVEFDGEYEEGESHGINGDLEGRCDGKSEEEREGARSAGGCGECRASPRCVRGSL
jgi:hypothetical protein